MAAQKVIVSLMTMFTLRVLGVTSDFDSYIDGVVKLTDVNTSIETAEYYYASARFGKQLPQDPSNYFKGMVVEATPIYGCGQIAPPPTTPLISWVAVIKRSKPGTSCSFVKKVFNAQLAGYSAAIIYDYKAEYDLVSMHSGNDTIANMIVIPSIFVSLDAGVEMCRLSYPHMTYAQFQPFKDGFLDPYKILIPMAFSFIGVLLVAIVVMVVRWCQALRRRRRSRISKAQLKKLPLVKYKDGDQYDCCAICLDDYDVGESVRLLPCGHTYHRKCIDPWLLKNKRTCPVCKRRVVPKTTRGSSSSHVPDSSDSDDVEDGRSESQPLLRPPIGRPVANDGASSSYGATSTGSSPRVETLHPHATGESSRPRRVRPHRRQYRRLNSTEGDDASDLRYPPSFGKRMEGRLSSSAGAHSLHTLPGDSSDDEVTLRPIPTPASVHVAQEPAAGAERESSAPANEESSSPANADDTNTDPLQAGSTVINVII